MTAESRGLDERLPPFAISKMRLSDSSKVTELLPGALMPRPGPVAPGANLAQLAFPPRQRDTVTDLVGLSLPAQPELPAGEAPTSQDYDCPMQGREVWPCPGLAFSFTSFSSLLACLQTGCCKLAHFLSEGPLFSGERVSITTVCFLGDPWLKAPSPPAWFTARLLTCQLRDSRL